MALVRPFGQSGLVIPANAAQNTLDRVVGGLGPEQCPAFTGSNWTLDLKSGAAGTVTQDATGITFAAANNITNGNIATTGPAMIDNGTYEVTYTVTNYTSGSFKVLVDGPTVNHGGPTTSKSAAGTYTERVTLNGTASNTNRIFFQAIGASGQNSFKVTAISVKRVL